MIHSDRLSLEYDMREEKKVNNDMTTTSGRTRSPKHKQNFIDDNNFVFYVHLYIDVYAMQRWW